MLTEILGLIVGSAEEAFLVVGVFVAPILLLFGYIDYKKAGKLTQVMEKSKRWQPILGALAGLIPGCGGAIMIMPLFFKKSVTFGTVVAALLASTGDSAFVLISTVPIQYLVVSVVAFPLAVFTGYLVDMSKLGENIIKKYDVRQERKEELIFFQQEKGYVTLQTPQKVKLQGFLSQNKLIYFYWIIIVFGLILGILNLFQVDINELFFPNLGVILGGSGTMFSIILMVLSKKILNDDTYVETKKKLLSMQNTFINNAKETAFIVTWVFVAFLVFESSMFIMGGGSYAAGIEIIKVAILATGLTSVILGAVVGLIPGCGPQIIFIVLFSKGIIPFAALLANAISQDGDALIPLLALDRRSAFWATVITTIPAVIIGLLVYWLEITFSFGRFMEAFPGAVFGR